MDDLEAIAQGIKAVGAENLVVDDLTEEDLPLVAWSGDQLHLESVAQRVALVPSGEMDYLAVRATDRQPVAIGGITYTEALGVGVIMQLSTRVQGVGLGTALILAAERRMRSRGVKTARLEVEDDNPRARALYERLGYREAFRHHGSWPQQHEDGTTYLYETVLTALDKPLPD